MLTLISSISAAVSYYTTNNFSAGICVWTATDIDDNGLVDIHDLFDLGRAYDSESGDLNWNPKCDFDTNGRVDFSDLSKLNENYGKIKPH